MPDITLRLSLKPEMPEEYTNASNQGTNQNPAGEPSAHDRRNSGARTAHEPTGPTLLGNPNQTLTQDSSLIERPVSAISANTTPIVGVPTGPSSGSQKPLTNPIQKGYQEAIARLSEAMQGGTTDKHIRNLQGQVQIW